MVRAAQLFEFLLPVADTAGESPVQEFWMNLSTYSNARTYVIRSPFARFHCGLFLARIKVACHEECDFSCGNASEAGSDRDKRPLESHGRQARAFNHDQVDAKQFLSSGESGLVRCGRRQHDDAIGFVLGGRRQFQNYTVCILREGDWLVVE